MAALSQNLLILSFILSLTLISLPRSNCKSFSDNPTLTVLGEGLDWPAFSYGDIFGGDSEEEDEEDDGRVDRRSLFWLRRYKYISYGALSANRVPCPPRSGRSYYTHSCFRARGPVHPYSRGCSMITRCRI